MRTLAFLLAAAYVTAAPGNGLITDDEIKPVMIDVERDFIQTKRGVLKPADLTKSYETAANREKNPRAKAIKTFALGEMYYRLERWSDARKTYAAAAALYDRFPLLHCSQSRLALRQKQFAEAEIHAKAALDLDEEYARAFNLLGRIELAKGRSLRAHKLYRKSFRLDANEDSCRLLAGLCTRLYAESASKREREDYRAEALNAAKVYRLLYPERPVGFMILADTQANLGMIEEACATLDESWRSNAPPRAKSLFMQRLFAWEAMRFDVAGAKVAAKRMLELKDHVSVKEIDLYRKRLEDLEEKQGFAFLIWEVEGRLDKLQNEGHDLDTRRKALWDASRLYIELLKKREPQLYDIWAQVRDAIIKTGAQGPPELTLDMLRFFKADRRDPRLVSILVYFIYPWGGVERPPEVRVEAIRTLYSVLGVAAFPSIFYSLQDDDGSVVRATDRALSDITSVRSPVGEGIEPLTAAQIKLSRRGWREYLHSEEGGERLIVSLEALRPHVRMRSKSTRNKQTAPLAQHIIDLVVDNDIEFAAWKEANRFLTDYMGMPFRAVDMRGKEVTPAERPDIVRRVEEWEAASDKPSEEEGEEGEEQ